MAAAILCIVTTDPSAFGSFAVYAAVLCAALAISRVPFGFAARRLLIIAPFAALIAAFIPFFKEGRPAASVCVGSWTLSVTREGLLLFWNVVVKASLSALCMVIVTSTTRFDRMLKGLEAMRCPRPLVMVLSFMYRYLFLFRDEAMRLARAREARSTGGGWALRMRSLSGIAGVLFIRAYERAERVYLAMCSRGFDGCIITQRSLRLRGADILFLVAAAAAFGAGRFAGGTS